MTIRFDYTNMMADQIGAEHGVLPADLDALRERAAAIHLVLETRRQNGELPFYDLPFAADMVAEVTTLADWVRSRFRNVVVLGIGGSALGTTAVFRALRPLWHNAVDHEKRGGLPRLFVLDNVDPEGFADHLDILDPAETCFMVISKSGTTVETSCQFLIARDWVRRAVPECFRDHFILVTDPENGLLRDLVRQEGYRSCAIPPGVGGRFSVLTPVGLLPLAACGVDIDGLLRGAARMAEHACLPSLMDNPAYLNAALQYLAYQKGQRISVMMPYSDRLRDVADWYCQLWAESLGKKNSLDGQTLHVGPTPVKALGTTDQHSQVQLYMEGPFDKVVTFIAVESPARDLEVPAYEGAPSFAYLAGHSMGELLRVEREATAAALKKNRRANCTISLSEVNPETVGGLLYLFEVQTLFAGYLFGVDPLDQPGVEEGKLFTYALMGRDGYADKRQEFESLQAVTNPRILMLE